MAYYQGNTYAVHSETRRSRAPCDRLTVTVYTVCHWQNIGAYCRGNNCCYPGTRRSKSPCDRATVTALCCADYYCLPRDTPLSRLRNPWVSHLTVIILSHCPRIKHAVSAVTSVDLCRTVYIGLVSEVFLVTVLDLYC